MPVTARTTFMPWAAIEMEQGEYDDLLRRGLIVLDDPAPEAGEAPAVPATEKPATGSRSGRRAVSSTPE